MTFNPTLRNNVVEKKSSILRNSYIPELCFTVVCTLSKAIAHKILWDFYVIFLACSLRIPMKLCFETRLSKDALLTT